MKIVIKQSSLILLSLILIGLFFACGSNKTESKQSGIEAKEITSATDVKIVYFHATRRCATCNAVEEVTKATITEHFDNNIPFQSLNREEDQNKAMVEKYKINGQTLLLISGDKVINLTNDAFLNARVKPERFEEILVENINGVIL